MRCGIFVTHLEKKKCNLSFRVEVKDILSDLNARQ